MSPSELENAPLETAMAMIKGMADEDVAHVFEEMAPGKVVSMMGEMEVSKASRIWSDMGPVPAGAVFEEVPTTAATEIVKLVPEDKLIPRLPEVTPEKLWDIPLGVLMDALPSVPVTHLDRWNLPAVDPELPPPRRVGDDVSAQYVLPQAKAGEWALVVGSPGIIDAIWAKFNRSLANVQVLVEVLSSPPAGAPDLPSGQIANSFFRVDFEGVAPDDIAVAAGIVSVEKSWLDANQVHKWSVQFDRFDEQQGAWVPFPSKRIREDAQRVSFALVVPGFSVVAVTGSREIPEQAFRVTDLGISPESPSAGEEVTISARVTNTGPQRAVYPAELWLNHSVEDAQTIVVESGATAPFSFTASKPEGEYRVRVERLLGELTVAPAAQPLATTGALIAIGVLAAGLVGAGYYVLRRRR